MVRNDSGDGRKERAKQQEAEEKLTEELLDSVQSSGASQIAEGKGTTCIPSVKTSIRASSVLLRDVFSVLNP